MSTERIKMEEKHFFVVHTYISDEARRAHLSPPEKRHPPQQRVTEREWAEKASQGKHAKLMQKWIGNDEFLYCHWIAKNERDVYRQLEEANLEGKIVNSMVHEVHEFMSAYRNSDEIYENFPEDGMYW